MLALRVARITNMKITVAQLRQIINEEYQAGQRKKRPARTPEQNAAAAAKGRETRQMNVTRRAEGEKANRDYFARKEISDKAMLDEMTPKEQEIYKKAKTKAWATSTTYNWHASDEEILTSAFGIDRAEEILDVAGIKPDQDAHKYHKWDRNERY